MILTEFDEECVKLKTSGDTGWPVAVGLDRIELGIGGILSEWSPAQRRASVKRGLVRSGRGVLPMDPAAVIVHLS